MLGQVLFGILMGVSAVPSPKDCPASDAVAAELQRLGTAGAVASLGSPEVTIHGARMRVGLRGADGTVSGVREVAAPASCLERAQVAAVLISAWVGAWSAGSFPEASRPKSPPDTASVLPALPTPATPPPAPVVGSPAPPAPSARTAAPANTGTYSIRPEPTVTAVAPAEVPAPEPAPEPAAAAPPAVPAAASSTATAAAPSRPARRVSVEVAVFGGGIHDGDAGAFGGGVQVGYRFPGWLGIDAAFAGSGERERSMGSGLPGSAAYRNYGLGIGLNLRRSVGPLLADLSLLPELTLLTVDGRNLSPGRSVTRWGAATTARLRVGLGLGRWRPFLFAGSGYALRGERLVVDGYPDRGIALSRWSFALGLGLAYRFGQTK